MFSPPPDTTTPRVLSIQSHVVHGYVGNKSAVFPLQLLGLEVDFVNSVQFSNHTGYPGFTGQVLNGEQLETLIQGLKDNSLTEGYSHLLTGYIGSVSFLRSVRSTLELLKQENPDLIYVCDPVLGDDGKLYVPNELVDIYRAEMLGVATVLTPNQFECETLVGRPITSFSDAIASCLWLHDRGPDIVVITSMVIPTDPGHIFMLASQRLGGRGEDMAGSEELEGGSTSHPCMFRLKIPRIAGTFTGTGDLTAALLLAWHSKHGCDLKLVLEKVAATLQTVIKHTYRVRGDRGELCLIQNKHAIEEPDFGAFSAEQISPADIHASLGLKQSKCNSLKSADS